MRNGVTHSGPNGLEVQKISTRDFLYPDADDKYTPLVLAYVHDFDIAALNERLKTMTPPEAVDAFMYLSMREKSFACRAMHELYTNRLAAGWPPLPEHVMIWLKEFEADKEEGHLQ